ncbi:MAG: UbiX family flavin prenyltransferase [Pseudolabrys sp.]|nr:UbiX family flavin prenyltransferase [Pseudolabrys sp.]MDP2295089.1 UbiX family flavin prenyltransferase [Pseudolabrys sp.]
MLQNSKGRKLPNVPGKRLIVGISGASGAIYGVRLLELLKDSEIETHLIMSRAARLTLAAETSFKVSDVEAMADVVHSNQDVGAACSSGSFQNLGMVIAPCSIKTMSEIATGVTANLMSRAADVALKERRRVVLMLRETPLHLGHIKSMQAVTEAGAIVYPPVPAFYTHPASLKDMIDHTLGRMLDLFGIDLNLVQRWTGEMRRPKAPAKSPAKTPR